MRPGPNAGRPKGLPPPAVILYISSEIDASLKDLAIGIRMYRSVACLALAATLMACSGGQVSEEETKENAAQRIARGRDLYVKNGCYLCHGDKGQADGKLSSGLRPKPRDFSQRAGYAQGHSVDEISETIELGMIGKPSAMPSYSHIIAADERRDIARYIVSLQGEREISTPTPSEPNGNDVSLQLSGAWLRPSLPPHETAVAYLEISNNSDVDDVLVGAAAAVAASVEFHLMSGDDDGMTRMRRLQQIPVPARGNVQLRPGGLHLMLTGLKRPLQAGESVGIELRFQKAGSLALLLPVKAQS